ncbi:MAG TPA: AAA family ATPase [Caulobacteraceae bacterium]|nr:AAA family ATPase [Caulobacteraceae bacterium]
MYLKKITTIKNIGRFKSAGVGGGEYARFTLFYGGNGRGKTTLCAILRSLQRNDPTLIAERQTFQTTGGQSVKLLTDQGVLSFDGGSWKSHSAQVEIFDQSYVLENVHGGQHVELDQRRNVYRAVIGAPGVKIANELDAIDATITEKTTAIAAERKAVEQHIPKGMTVEKFVALAADPDVEMKLNGARSKLLAANNASAVASRKPLVEFSLPRLPNDLTAVLLETIDGVSAQATSKVKAQLDSHQFGDDGEEWLAKGVEHVSETCPFCAVSVSGNQLVEAYKGYFGAAYGSLKKRLADLRNEVAEGFGEAGILKAERALQDVADDAGFWKDYTSIRFVPPSLPELRKRMEAVGQAALEMLDAKIAAPLDAVPLSGSFEAAEMAWSETCDLVEKSNATVTADNALIASVKVSSGQSGKAAVEADVAGLELIKKRHTPPVSTLVDGYKKLIIEKAELVKGKDAKKAELDAYDKQVLADFEKGVNRYLTMFGASFRLTNCEKTYQGKAPQSVYCIDFDAGRVDVGGNAKPGEPSFASTMSAGDKSTLALAFFMAQLEKDTALNGKVVVYDDPFTSLDDFRREMTAKSIYRIGTGAAQTIVLSHDKYFLQAVANKIVCSHPTPMQISTTAGNSSIEPWDLEREVKEGYLQDHMKLIEFVAGSSGTAQEMRTLMRPLLEKYLRYRFPNSIPDGKWLGDMLGIIKADPNHPMTSHYAELDDINQYTAPFHHDPNTAFNPDEVLTYVKRTLAIVGGA